MMSHQLRAPVKKRLEFFQSLSRHWPVHSSFCFFHSSHLPPVIFVACHYSESTDRILSKEGNNTKEIFDGFCLDIRL